MEGTPQVIFKQVLESLERVLGTRLDGPLRERYRAELGIDFSRLDPAYPLDTWNRAVQVAMGVLCPGQSAEQGQAFLGRRVVETYMESFIGAALFGVLRVLGPKRALLRMTRNLRSSNNYTESKVDETGPGEYRLWLNQVALPWFDQGVLEAGLRSAGAPRVTVDVVAHDAQGTTYRVALNA